MSDREEPAPASAPAPAAEQDAPRSRSRSPPRNKTKKSGSSGFKWKQKPAAAVDDDRGDSRRDDRGGASSRPSYRDDYNNRDRDYRHPDRRGDDRGSGGPPRDYDRGGAPRDYRHPDRRRDDRDRDTDYRRRSRSPRRDRERRDDRDRSRERPRKEKKDKPAPAPAPVAAAADGEEMIIVHVNDRLGTKAAIPCFASDDIKSFKVMVAARIGREPHEILLKRQGERPFKDHITLGDYGVSNGVQLDLEVDTGD